MVRENSSAAIAMAAQGARVSPITGAPLEHLEIMVVTVFMRQKTIAWEKAVQFY